MSKAGLMSVMRRGWWSAATLALTLAATAAQAQPRAETIADAQRALAAAERALPPARVALARWTLGELSTFASVEEFEAYRAAVRRADQAEQSLNDTRAQLELAKWCAAKPGECPVTSRIRRPHLDTGVPVTSIGGEGFFQQGQSNIGDTLNDLPQLRSTFAQEVAEPSLTNVQEIGVDEGDIVKQLGRHLLILQDGRIFVVDKQGGPDGDRLVLVDRADVYRHPNEDAWYDELMVHGDRAIVTGYSYRLNASEIAIFRIGAEGRLTREAVFQIKSQDYYSTENYSSRIVGDELILYTPVPVASSGKEGFQWPRLRRVPIDAGAKNEGAFREGTDLLTPQDLYRPLMTLDDPVIHLVTRCSLAARSSEGRLGCQSRGFIGPESREFYVAGAQAFLWTYGSEAEADWWEQAPCRPGQRPPTRDVATSVVYRIGLLDGSAGVMSASGGPVDQLGLDASNGRFRGLLGQWSRRCRHDKGAPFAYLEVPESAFGKRLRPAPASAYTAMPDIGAVEIENRFTDRYLIFGGRSARQYGAGQNRDERLIGGGDVVVVPIERPQQARRVRLPHRVWRTDRVGENALFTGYGDRRGLELSVVDLRGAEPRLASTLRLEGRFESEGRSHAFNSLIGADGAGLAGLPTVLRAGAANREPWRSDASDVSFLSIDATGELHSLGALETRAEIREWYGIGDQEPEDPSVYRCQVSCMDWYGNSRPLFTGGRIFALTATELVEGRVRGGRISEVQRIDLTKTDLPPHLRPTGATRAGAE